MAVHVLGIRHHGPGSARAVAAALAHLQPDLVLVEGPPEADPLLALAAHPHMRPPVALLGYVLDTPERAVFHPLVSFSPEWQAIRHGIVAGVPVRGCDLPLAVTLAASGEGQGTLEGVGEASNPARVLTADPLALLAEAAGYADPERWWEDVVEHRAEGPFVAVTEAMAAVRDALGADVELAGHREARREAAMRQAVRRGLADGHREIAVVCGAWHAPALVDPGPAGPDARLLRGLPKAKVGVTWVPWTHSRLASASGYGAGVTSPGWYHHVFEHAGPEVVARWFAEAAAVLRAAGRPVSPASVIDATRLAEALAAVRGRPHPGLGEVVDAARAVLGDGSDTPMVLLHERLVVGQQLGAVPDTTPMVPLARDLAAHQRRLRLKPGAGTRTLELDLRRDRDRARSHLLHRLALLGVPWGVLRDSRASTGTFRETWTLTWQPELEIRLIDASALGTTVVAAATARLRQVARGSGALADLTAAVEAALLADLPDAVGDVTARLAEQAALDTDTSHLMDALGPLARVVRYGDVRGSDAAVLSAVVEQIVVRVAEGLPLVAASIDDAAAGALAGRLTAVQAALALLAAPEHRRRWFEALHGLVGTERLHGLVRGRAGRLLLDGDELPPGEAGGHLARALSVGTPPAEGAAFVEGFLGASGAVLLHDDTLLGLLDGWIASLGHDAFDTVVPLLRRTFGAFEPAERRLIGERVARGPTFGHRRPEDVDADRAAAALATLADLLGVAR